MMYSHHSSTFLFSFIFIYFSYFPLTVAFATDLVNNLISFLVTKFRV